MIITAVEKRKKFLNALYIDNEFVALIDREVLYIKGIKVGMSIDDEKLYELICESDNKRAKEKALYYLAKRDYSRKELIEKVKRTTSQRASEFAVDKMEELGLLSDESYAQKYAHDLINLKGFSKKRVESELRLKGIDRDIISNVLANIEVDAFSMIYELINRKYRNKLSNEKDRRRTIASLQRMGYRWEDIKPSIDEFMSQEDCEEYIDVL